MVKMKNSLNLWVLQKIFPNICKAKKNSPTALKRYIFQKQRFRNSKIIPQLFRFSISDLGSKRHICVIWGPDKKRGKNWQMYGGEGEAKGAYMWQCYERKANTSFLSLALCVSFCVKIVHSPVFGRRRKHTETVFYVFRLFGTANLMLGEGVGGVGGGYFIIIKWTTCYLLLLSRICWKITTNGIIVQL